MDRDGQDAGDWKERVWSRSLSWSRIIVAVSLGLERDCGAQADVYCVSNGGYGTFV